MNEKNSFHYDPLYRVIDVTEEMRFIEGSFKKHYDRLKGISNLGIIPQLLGMAKYSKYEHSQPYENPVTILDPDEIENDLEDILNWLADFKKR